MATEHDITWEHKGWHYLVHSRLGEVLFYYLARIRPFSPKKAIDEIDLVIKKQKLGSVRVFPIFGPYDLLIRAWLHPSVETQFRAWLEQELEHCKTLRPFAVTSIDFKWYVDDGIQNKGASPPLISSSGLEPKVDFDLLAKLDGKMVRAVQNDEDPILLGQLIRGRLVVERKKLQAANNIKFFTAVNLEDDGRAARSDIIKGIERFIINRDVVQFASIYRGFGFCSILVKGQVNDYFEVSELPNWIGNEYSDFGISTETYLVHGPTHVAGNEDIGDSTFNAIEGRNLFIQSIIPELYDEPDSDIKWEIDRFLREVEHNEPHAKDLSQEDKKILHDYFLGLLKDNYSLTAQTLFIFFYSLEGFLRERHKEFISELLKSGPAIGELYKEINFGKAPGKFLSLGDLLRIYKLAIERVKAPEYSLLLNEWQDLVVVRNRIAHGDVDFSKDWRDIMTTLVKQLDTIHRLVELIEKITNTIYTQY
jgi:hypothetical protein